VLHTYGLLAVLRVFQDLMITKRELREAAKLLDFKPISVSVLKYIHQSYTMAVEKLKVIVQNVNITEWKPVMSSFILRDVA